MLDVKKEWEEEGGKRTVNSCVNTVFLLFYNCRKRHIYNPTLRFMGSIDLFWVIQVDYVSQYFKFFGHRKFKK